MALTLSSGNEYLNTSHKQQHMHNNAQWWDTKPAYIPVLGYIFIFIYYDCINVAAYVAHI